MVSVLQSFKQSIKTHALSDITIGLIGSGVIALASQVAITIPYFSVFVPFTLQPQAVLMLSALLGSRRALLCVCFFLLEGAGGLPVFAEGGSALSLVGPTGGYLISYLPVSFMVGSLFDRVPQPGLFLRMFFFCFGTALIYLFGATWLSTFVGMGNAWKFGVLPFVLTDFCKALAVAAFLPVAWKSSWSRWLGN